MHHKTQNTSTNVYISAILLPRLILNEKNWVQFIFFNFLNIASSLEAISINKDACRPFPDSYCPAALLRWIT